MLQIIRFPFLRVWCESIFIASVCFLIRVHGSLPWSRMNKWKTQKMPHIQWNILRLITHHPSHISLPNWRAELHQKPKYVVCGIPFDFHLRKHSSPGTSEREKSSTVCSYRSSPGLFFARLEVWNWYVRQRSRSRRWKIDVIVEKTFPFALWMMFRYWYRQWKGFRSFHSWWQTLVPTSSSSFAAAVERGHPHQMSLFWRICADSRLFSEGLFGLANQMPVKYFDEGIW